MATAPRPRSSRTRKTPRYQPVLELPPLPPEQHEALRGNIALHGVLVPILVDGDGPVRVIIDGNRRKGIADELGYDCPEVVKDGLSDQEKRTLARALNLARRQLDQAGKRAIIADQLRETPGRSNRWVGKQLGVHHATVASVRADLEGTGQIIQLERTVGADGKARPASRPTGRDGEPGRRTDPEAEEDDERPDELRLPDRRRSYNCTHHFDMVGRPADIETPPGLCRFLHDLIAPLHEVRTILDPCAGRDNLTTPWERAEVVSYEIKRGRDFLATTGRIDCDLVLCNPPFSGDNGGGKVNLVPVFLRAHPGGRAARDPDRPVRPDDLPAGAEDDLIPLALGAGRVPADHLDRLAAQGRVPGGGLSLRGPALQHAEAEAALLPAGRVPVSRASDSGGGRDGGRDRRVLALARRHRDGHPAVFPGRRAAASAGGDLVLDPFCGIGQTLLAAKGCGRHYQGIEREEEFVRVAMNRLGG